jgi:hypothetical protein
VWPDRTDGYVWELIRSSMHSMDGLLLLFVGTRTSSTYSAVETFGDPTAAEVFMFGFWL